MVNGLFVDFKLAVELIHQGGVNENDQNENVDGALLGKPKSELESAHFNVIELINEEDAKSVGHDKPYTEENGKESQVALPILFGGFVWVHCFGG